MIPKNIYYVWVGGEKPPKIQECLESWSTYLKNFKIHELNESNIDFNRNRMMKSAYDNQKWPYVADCAKIYHAINHPGIYLDTDFQFINTIPDSILDTDGSFFASESPRVVCCGVFGVAHKNNPVILRLANQLDRATAKDGTKGLYLMNNIKAIMKEAGFTSQKDGTVEELSYEDTDVKVYSRDYFLPISWNPRHETHFTDNTVAVHRWTASYLGDGACNNFLKIVHQRENEAKKQGKFSFNNENYNPTNESQRIQGIITELHSVSRSS